MLQFKVSLSQLRLQVANLDEMVFDSRVCLNSVDLPEGIFRLSSKVSDLLLEVCVFSAKSPARGCGILVETPGVVGVFEGDFEALLQSLRRFLHIFEEVLRLG